MNGNVAVALLLLAYLVVFCVYIVADVNRLCDEQLEQEQDELELRRRNAEAVQAIASAE